MNPILRQALQRGIFPITRRIAIGQFATLERLPHLRDLRITHILNVGEAPSLPEVISSGFQQVLDQSIADLTRIPNQQALECLDILHRMLQVNGSKVYLHCIACQNRSPTILWLYLIGCGLDPSAAKTLIVDRCPDAIPGHEKLVDEDLVQKVREHGQKHYLPSLSSDMLEPAYGMD